MLAGKKTYITGILAILGAIAAILTGSAPLADSAQIILTAVLAMTVRDGITPVTGILAGKKTYVVAAMSAITAVGGYLAGDLTLMAAVQAVVTAALASGIRGGISASRAGVARP